MSSEDKEEVYKFNNKFSPEQLEEEYRKSFEKEKQDQKPVTVLVAGDTGSGKSTLINAVFGREVARTGTGRPITENLEEFLSTNPPLRVLDTRGFEPGDGVAFEKVDAELTKRRAQGDPDVHIHMAWLCILSNSNRFAPVHERFIKGLADRGIPCVIVLTQTDREDDKIFSYIKGLLIAHRENFPDHKIEVIELLAAPIKQRSGTEISAYGVENLLELTYKFIDDGKKTAFAQAQIASISLKKKEAHRIVGFSAASAAATAAIPMPGGHSVALVTIQVAMMAKIDLIFGQSLLVSKTAMQGIATRFVSMGGKWTFGLALENVLKFFPGVGSAAGTLVGGTVGSAATIALGFSYIEVSSKVLAKEIDIKNLSYIVDALTTGFEKNRSSIKE